MGYKHLKYIIGHVLIYGFINHLFARQISNIVITRVYKTPGDRKGKPLSFAQEKKNILVHQLLAHGVK